MRVDRVEQTASGVRCVAVDPRAPGLVARATVKLHAARLIVVELLIERDPLSHAGEALEITRAALRVFDPPAIVRALTDYAAAVALPELRAWFTAWESPTGVALADALERVDAMRRDADPPSGRGRPRKYTDVDLVRWARTALTIDAERPRSLRRALADAMSSSGGNLSGSTPENARDLLRELRTRGYLQPARRAGAREPLLPGPNLPLEDER